MNNKRVYYYEKDNLKVKVSTARYIFCLPLLNNKIVVDIGCGARKGPQLVSDTASKIIGLDISTEAVLYSAKTWPAKNLSYLVSDAKDLALKSDSFDAVLSFEVIEHIDDYKSYLNEVYRILKKEGTFIISTPNRIIASPDGIFSNPDHIREFDYQEFKNVLSCWYSNIEFYGQKSSSRVMQIQANRKISYQNVARIPVFVRHIVPKYFRERLLELYTGFRVRFSNIPSDKDVDEKDFFIEKKDIEKAEYFLVICKNNYSERGDKWVFY